MARPIVCATGRASTTMENSPQLQIQDFTLRLGPAVCGYVTTPSSLDHSICFLVVLRLEVSAFIKGMPKICYQVGILFKCYKGQKIIEKKVSVESNGQPSNGSTSGDV